jgi:phosphoglycolate phosphatase
MKVQALATDYDETLAEHGTVSAATLAALERLRATGRKLILVTGRELPDLRQVFPKHDLFDRIVAENGAVLYTPATGELRLLAPAPPREFARRLAAREVAPLYQGHVIIATLVPNETIVLEEIRQMGLELEIIFNKGAVMVLPSGINKATGLAAALAELDLLADGVVAVGDAENDHAFLRSAGLGAAVANALPAVKETAGLTLSAGYGAGVRELIDLIIARDGALMGRR